MESLKTFTRGELLASKCGIYRRFYCTKICDMDDLPRRWESSARLCRHFRREPVDKVNVHIMKPFTGGAVLLADDDRNDRELFRLATQDANWPNRVVGFEDGEHLVRYLNGRGVERPALIVLDLNMTSLGGIGVLYWLRARRDLDGVPAIILSSSSQDRDIREAIA